MTNQASEIASRACEMKIAINPLHAYIHRCLNNAVTGSGPICTISAPSGSAHAVITEKGLHYAGNIRINGMPLIVGDETITLVQNIPAVVQASYTGRPLSNLIAFPDCGNDVVDQALRSAVIAFSDSIDGFVIFNLNFSAPEANHDA